MRNALGAVLALVLSACAAPAYQAPQTPLPAEFRETSAAPNPGAEPEGAAFWEALGDTTLARLMRQALQANHDLRVAAARVRQARSDRLLAALDFAPTVTVNGGYTRQRLASATFPGIGSFPDQDIWDAGFDATWELDVFGRIRRNVQGSNALLASAQADARDVRVLVGAELARTYFELSGAQGQLAVARQNAENQRRTLDLTTQRLEAGRGTAFDTERARAQLSTTLAGIPTLEARVASAQYRIGVLVGRPPAALAEELAAVRALPPLPAAPTIPSPDSLVRSRPDVVSAERQLAAESAFLGSAKSEYLPRLALAGGAGFTATTFDSLGKSGTSRYAVGPVISWPALNLGRVKARADAASARREAARARYEQSVLRAMQEVETALVQYRTARSRLAQLDDAAGASERAANLARLRYQEGVADFLQVLDAERTLLAAQDQLAQGRTDAATAYVGLVQALGGTWPASPAQ